MFPSYHRHNISLITVFKSTIIQYDALINIKNKNRPRAQVDWSSINLLMHSTPLMRCQQGRTLTIPSSLTVFNDHSLVGNGKWN